MPGRNRVTIHCVAREAGVSPQTVSRVINDRPDVAPQNRQRVREVITRLGFQPSNAARSLSLGQSCTLGVVSYGLEYFSPARTLSGVERVANDLGYTLLLSLIRAPKNNGAQVLRDLLAHHADGVICAVPEIGKNRHWIIEETSRFSIPLVFIDTRPHPSLPVVNVDNRGGGRVATKYLLEQGSRKGDFTRRERQ
jgi:LacI family transcriptional regulator